MANWIRQTAENGNPPTRVDILHLWHRIRRSDHEAWVNSMRLGNRGQIFHAHGMHHKDMKLQLPRIFGGETIREITESVPGSVSQVAFDLDEVSIPG
jgi:hypothetical protein